MMEFERRVDRPNCRRCQAELFLVTRPRPRKHASQTISLIHHSAKEPQAIRSLQESCHFLGLSVRIIFGNHPACNELGGDIDRRIGRSVSKRDSARHATAASVGDRLWDCISSLRRDQPRTIVVYFCWILREEHATS